MALSLSSVSEVLGRIATARNVTFATYVLQPGGDVQKALAAAARRGAHVTVTVQKNPYRNEDGIELNRRSAAALRQAGARVTLLTRDAIRFHVKAAVCDGVAYLDDRNWTKGGRELVLRDDAPRHVALVRAALGRHDAGSDRTLTLSKDVALAREAALIRRAGDAPVIVESEYADSSHVTDALRRHAARGAPTTLILSRWRHCTRKEDALIAALRVDGVDVRETGTNEKLALVGDRAWIGSANATEHGPPGQIDWAVVTRNPAVVNGVGAVLRRDGGCAPLPATGPTGLTS